MKNNKICFYIGDLNPGGVAHLVINLAHEFLRKGYEVHFFLTNRRGQIEDELPSEIKIFRSGNSVKSTFTGLMAYLKKERPHAVVSARDNLNVVNAIACKLSGTKTKSVASVHVDYSAVTQKFPLRIQIYRLFVYISGLLFYRFANETIAVSKGVADNHAKRFFLNRKKITVIYNPTYKELKSDEEDEIHAFTEKFQKPLFSSVGRLTAQKGFDVLIKGFSMFRNEHKSGSLLILGEGEDRQKLEDLAKKMGVSEHVYMPGYVKTPALYVKYSDVFVCSSLWEGFGNVVVEALGVGAKIISTDCKSGPAEILEDGKYGILVPVSSPESLKSAMQKQLEAPISRLEQIERAKDFSVSKIANEYLELIYK